jgi:N-acetylglutamate synthase-like GNAT family acetyltransferase
MFQVRALNEQDYDSLVEWAKWFKFPYPPKEMLPNNGTGGIMVTKDGIDVCAGFIYTTNSKIAWLEWIVSNPEYRNKDRQEAIKILIDGLCNIAQSLGFKAVFTSVKNQSLINHFKDIGFSLDSHKSSEMVKRLI